MNRANQYDAATRIRERDTFNQDQGMAAAQRDDPPGRGCNTIGELPDET